MISSHHSSRWRRIALAAARLALLYAAGATILLLVFITLTDGLSVFAEAFAELLLPAATLFALAFAVLGIARRAGLITLWVLLLGFWVWALRADYHMLLPTRFAAWTAFAAPLYALVASGIPSRFNLRRDRWHLSPMQALAVLWAMLTILALYYNPLADHAYDLGWSPEQLLTIARIIFWPAPFLIAGLALTHLFTSLTPVASAKRLHN